MRSSPTIAIVAAAILGVGGIGGLLYYRSQHPGVIDLDNAWNRVRADPHDATAWAALADAQSAIDQLRAAEESYRTAIRISLDEPTVLARLGFLLYGRGEDAAALSLLEQAQHHGVELPLLAWTVNRLRASRAAQLAELHDQREHVAAEVEVPEPESPPVDLPCTLPLRKGGAFMVTVHLNGEETTLIFDTGASITTLDRLLIERLGVPIDEEQTITAITASGRVRFATAVIDEVTLAGRQVEHLTVAVCEGCGGDAFGGLLGLDLQAGLGIELQLRERRLRFTDCDER